MSNNEHWRSLRRKVFRKNASRYIAAFCLSIIYTVIGLAVLVQFITSENVVRKSFDEQYASYMFEYLEETAADYTQPTFISASVLDGVFSKEAILADISKYIAAAYRGESYAPDTAALEAGLKNNVDNFFKESGIADDPSAEEIAASYVCEIADIYKDALQIQGIEYVVKANGLVKRYLWIINTVAIILGTIMASIYRGMRYCAYASGGACAATLIVPLVFYITKMNERLRLSPRYFYCYVTNYIGHALTGFVVAAIVWLAITVLFVLATWLVGQMYTRRCR